MKKIEVKKELFNPKVSAILAFVSVVSFFVGCCIVGACPYEKWVGLTIGIILLSSGLSFLIIAGFASNEGILGLIFGAMIAASIVAMFLTIYVGVLPWLPDNDGATQTTLWLIALPLILGGGGAAGAVRIFVVFI